MAKTVPIGREPVVIGRRARAIRRLRGLSLDGVAGLAGMIGYHDLALSAGRRELDAATRLGDPVAMGLARFGWAWKWVNVGARPQADAANKLALAELEAVADPSVADTGAAEILGMHHLLAARAGRASTAHDHLDAARELAGPDW